MPFIFTLCKCRLRMFPNTDDYKKRIRVDVLTELIWSPYSKTCHFSTLQHEWLFESLLIWQTTKSISQTKRHRVYDDSTWDRVKNCKAFHREMMLQREENIVSGKQENVLLFLFSFLIQSMNMWSHLFFAHCFTLF